MAKRTKENIDRIIELYQSGAPIGEIRDECKITERGITGIRKRFGIPVRDRHIYKVNESFFKNWSNEMAWVLGLLITDGCIAASLNTFSFSQNDEPLVKKVREVLGSEHPIIPPKGTRNLYTVNVGSKAMVEDLVKLGVTPKKSLTMKIPDVPLEYLPHFLRGVFEGNGWVQKTGYVLNITGGSFAFIQSLHEVFEALGFNSKNKPETAPSGREIYRAWISGKEDVERFYEFIYKETGIYFSEKKKAKFATFKEERLLKRKVRK